MQNRTRYLWLALLPALAVGLQFALRRHVEAAVSERVTLADELERFPTRLAGWQGRDLPIESPIFLYGDAHLNRVYGQPANGQSISLWMAYSATGEDRAHHPEVCMAAAGKREDSASRKLFELEGSGEPVQEYRFVHKTGGSQRVFYWHYTLPVDQSETGQSWLQVHYRPAERRRASLTIEVFAPELADDDISGAENFVREVDRAIQPFLPAGSERGSKRVPFLLIGDARLKPKG